MDSPLSLMSRPLHFTLLAGVTLTAGGIIYSYLRRRASVTQDIAESTNLGITNDSTSVLKQNFQLLLSRDHVFCADIEYVHQVIDSLIAGGPQKLQVIADFDKTLTPLSLDGKAVPLAHGVIECSPHLPEWYNDELAKIMNHYEPIEVDHSLSYEEQVPLMEEFVRKLNDLIVSCSLTKKDIFNAVRLSNLYLREKSKEVLELLHTMEIPLLVFSAGIGDVIEQTFIQRYRLYNNIHIISNWMEFDKEDKLIAFKGETIHVFNKNVHAKKNVSYFESIRQRHNVILLGDSLGDLDIAEGLVGHNNLLTIGYLNCNRNVNACLPVYKQRYDIVLVEEEGLDVLQSLLRTITAT